MSSLRAPGLGPIVGHTTDRTCRLWMQAPIADDSKRAAEEDRRTLGVLVVTARAGVPLPPAARPVYYFRLRREFDRTGTFNLGEEGGLGGLGEPYLLAPDTEYRVRLASLAVDDDFENDVAVASDVLAERLPNPRVWAGLVDELPADACEAVFGPTRRSVRSATPWRSCSARAATRACCGRSRSPTGSSRRWPPSCRPRATPRARGSC
jgi:alkaline phosphatase D